MSVIHLSPAAKRWQEVVNDPQLSQRLERIETDACGQVIMAPPLPILFIALKRSRFRPTLTDFSARPGL